VGCSDDKGGNNQPKNAICPISNGYPALFEGNINSNGRKRNETDEDIADDEERILKDYDRIYPPSSDAGVSLARYNEMEIHAASVDERQHQRLTRPSQQKFTNVDVENKPPTQSNRRDGNMPRGAMEETKIIAPPTKKPQTQSIRRDSWMGINPREALEETK
jgi:hypothetical protein